jgi:hypothetical protein
LCGMPEALAAFDTAFSAAVYRMLLIEFGA